MRPLEGMAQLETELKNHSGLAHFILKRNAGAHCIDILFSSDVPVEVMQDIKNKIRGRYPELNIIPTQGFDFKICTNCNGKCEL